MAIGVENRNNVILRMLNLAPAGWGVFVQFSLPKVAACLLELTLCYGLFGSGLDCILAFGHHLSFSFWQSSYKLARINIINKIKT